MAKLANDSWIKSPVPSNIANFDSEESAKECKICTDGFQGLKIKHHCRNCGNAVCGNCSELLTLQKQSATAQRICSSCRTSEDITNQLNVPYVPRASQDYSSGSGGGGSPTHNLHKAMGSPVGESDEIPDPVTPFTSKDSYKGTGQTPFFRGSSNISSGIDDSNQDEIGAGSVPSTRSGSDSSPTWIDSTPAQSEEGKSTSKSILSSTPLSVRSHRGSDAGSSMSSPQRLSPEMTPPSMPTGFQTSTKVAGGHIVDFSVELPNIGVSLENASVVGPSLRSAKVPQTPAAIKHNATFTVIPDTKRKKNTLWLPLVLLAIVAALAAVLYSNGVTVDRIKEAAEALLKHKTQGLSLQQQREEAERRLAVERAENEEKTRLKRETKAARKKELAAQAQREKESREAEEKARKEREAKAAREAEEKARKEREAKAAREAEEQARKEREAKAAREAEEQARKEREAKAAREAEEQARKEREAKAAREAEEQARKEREAKAAREAEVAQAAKAAAMKKKISFDASKVPNPVVNLSSQKANKARMLKSAWLDEEMASLSPEERISVESFLGRSV